MTQRLSAVLAVALWVTVGATADPVTPPLVAPLAAEQRPKAHLTHRFLQQASDLGLWSGTIACSDTAEGISVYYKDAFGMASHELEVPLRPELRMPIGSTTKAFTAVAIYQLQEQGKLNISDPASKYLDMTAFGLPNPWCPRLNTSGPGGPCEEPTLDQMLAHTSGMWDSASCMLNPDSIPAYQLPYCFANRLTNYTEIMREVAGLTPTMWELANWTVSIPLFSKPGERYSYSNNGYYLLGYIAEQVSGVPLPQYFQENIFGPAYLGATFYDPSMGGAGFHPNTVWNGGYITLMNVSASENNRSLDVTTKTLAAPTPAVLEAGHSAPFYSGIISLTASAGGAMSSVEDALKWYQTLFSDPDRIGLSEAAWEDLKAPRAPIAGPIFYNHGVQSNQNLSSGGVAYFHRPCALIGNTIADVEFGSAQARALFEERCKSAPGLEQLLAGMAEREPPPVANMTAAERQAALLPHLCQVVLGPYMGASNDYIRRAVEVEIWQLNEW